MMGKLLMAIDLDMLALKLGGMLPTMTLDLDLDRYGQLTAASLAAFLDVPHLTLNPLLAMLPTP